MEIMEKKFKRVSDTAELAVESSVDYILPDYYGDVRKILYTECVARPSGKFTDEEEVEFSGIVVYNVVYLDSENKPTGVSFTSDYDGAVKCRTEGLVGAYAEPSVTSYNVRLTGPRRFSAKATVGAATALVCEDIIAASGTSFVGETEPETLTRVMNLRSVEMSERVEREYAEVIERLEGVIADEVEIIYSGAETLSLRAEVGEEKVNVLGELLVYAVVSTPDSPLYFVEKRIPIEEAVPFPGVTGAMSLIPIANAVSLVTNVNASETGAEIAASAVVEYEVRGEYNENVRVVSDAFVRSCPTENTYRNYEYTELRERVSLSEGVRCEVERGELPCENLHQILYLIANPKINTVLCDGDKLKLVGEVRFSGIASEVNEEGDVSYTGIKLSVPLEESVKCASGMSEGIACEYNFSQTLASPLIDGDKIEINYTLSGGVTVSEKKSESVLASSDAITEQSYEESSGKITVYYPEGDETLFEVARKFHKSLADIAEDNDIASTTSLDGSSVKVGDYQRIYIF